MGLHVISEYHPYYIGISILAYHILMISPCHAMNHPGADLATGDGGIDGEKQGVPPVSIGT